MAAGNLEAGLVGEIEMDAIDDRDAGRPCRQNADAKRDQHRQAHRDMQRPEIRGEEDVPITRQATRGWSAFRLAA